MSSRGIFLSYRREDAAPYARLLHYQLRERFPDANVFIDMDSIEPGLDFAEVIREALDSSVVLVALIGRQWLTLADEQGRRRLDDSDDFVRFEVQTALERGVRVIPVLVDGAQPLRLAQLPGELGKLARLNALELSYSRYEYDVGRLLDLIQRVAAASATATAPESSSPANSQTLVVADDIVPGSDAVAQAAHTDPEVARKDRPRITRVLSNAKHVAESITDEVPKATALADIARALAATDPNRAARLIADAERIAQSLTDEGRKDKALVVLAAIAGAVAATDPDRAERISQSITNEDRRVNALVAIAEA